MTACAQQFEEGGIGVYQVLASKRAPYSNPLPLTRDDLYEHRRPENGFLVVPNVGRDYASQ